MRSRSLLFVGAVMVASLWASLAGAQAVPPAPPVGNESQLGPAPPPATTLPILKKDEGAEYPRQALADGIHDAIEVRLVLTIDPQGLVTKAVVEAPVGHGFDEAAIAAGEKLEFEPATRGGLPVAAKFRYLYRFPPPPAILAGRVVTLAG